MGCAAGDLARWLPNGTIDFMGRLDNQVLLPELLQERLLFSK